MLSYAYCLYLNRYRQLFLAIKTLVSVHFSRYNADTADRYDGVKASSFANQHGFWLGYGYVANRAGGFYGLWTGSYSGRVEVGKKRYELYLQMETTTGDPTTSLICLKLSCSDGCSADEIRAARNSIAYDGNAYRPARYRFKRPNRLVLGKHMSIGVFDYSYNDSASALTALEQASEEYLYADRCSNDIT